MYSTSVVCIQRISHCHRQSLMESNVKFLIHYLTKKINTGEAPIGLSDIKKLKCRCPVSDVTIEVLCIYTECNHILGPTLVYVCMLNATMY
jgi:hypothetical protein